MDKKTINRLLTGSIFFLSGVVIVLGALIYDKSKTVQIENTKDTFVDMQEETQEQGIEEESYESDEQEQERKKLAETITRVNIRNIDSEDGKVLETVEAGAQYEFVEVLESGWTKIIYDGQDGFINSKFVKLVDAPEEAEPQEIEDITDAQDVQEDTAPIDTSSVEEEQQTTVAEEMEEEQSTMQEDKPVIDASTILH